MCYPSLQTQFFPSTPLFRLQVGGISLRELNALEAEMFRRLEHRLVVTPEVVRMYLRMIQVIGLRKLLGRRMRMGGGQV